jgi:rhamnosyl/mannosyltransferase
VPFVNEHGVSGLVVPPGDADALAEALRTLVADDGLRARLGVQAQERVRAEFTREMMVERTLAVYHEVSEAV